MKVATNEENIIKEILSEPGLNELTSKKIQVRKVLVCFGNNIAPFLVNNKCFRSGLRCIFVSHWVNEFSIQLFTTEEKIGINCIL